MQDELRPLQRKNINGLLFGFGDFRNFAPLLIKSNKVKHGHRMSYSDALFYRNWCRFVAPQKLIRGNGLEISKIL